MKQKATIQIFFRCPEALGERFDQAIQALSPTPSRNALMVHLIEEWLKGQEKEQGNA